MAKDKEKGDVVMKHISDGQLLTVERVWERAEVSSESIK